MFDLYSGNTGCWRWNNTSTSYLLWHSLCIDLVWHARQWRISYISFSPSLFCLYDFGRLFLYKRLYCSCFLSSSTIIIHVFFFVRSLDTNLFCLSRSHSCSGTEVNNTAFTRSPHKIIIYNPILPPFNLYTVGIQILLDKLLSLSRLPSWHQRDLSFSLDTPSLSNN